MKKIIEKLQKDGNKVRISVSGFQSSLSTFDIFAPSEYFHYSIFTTLYSNKTLASNTMEEIMEDFEKEYYEKEVEFKLRNHLTKK